jgi:hypothetical protein
VDACYAFLLEFGDSSRILLLCDESQQSHRDQALAAMQPDAAEIKQATPCAPVAGQKRPAAEAKQVAGGAQCAPVVGQAMPTTEAKQVASGTPCATAAGQAKLAGSLSGQAVIQFESWLGNRFVTLGGVRPADLQA